MNKVKSRSDDSVISTVSLEHAIAGKDTDKNITATLNGQDITGICVEADAPEGCRCNHPQRRQTYQGCGRGCYHPTLAWRSRHYTDQNPQTSKNMSFDLRSFNRQIMKAYREMQEFNERGLRLISEAPPVSIPRSPAIRN